MKLLKLFPFAALFGVVFLAQPASAQPVEYVRVCDAYGTGWFYIPGTEQCLKVATGEIRIETEDGTVVTQSELAARVEDLESDAAIANALEDPDLIAGERFGVRVNWGAAGAENAAGVTGSVVLNDSVFGEKGRLTGSGGVGYTNGRVGGRAGMQLTW
jgi:hypothetical protein